MNPKEVRQSRPQGTNDKVDGHDDLHHYEHDQDYQEAIATTRTGQNNQDAMTAHMHMCNFTQ